MSDRRRDIATTVVGTGLTAGSGVIQEAGNRRGFKVTGSEPKPFRPKALVHLKRGGKGMGRARALFLVGAGTGVAGVTGMGTGVYRLTHPKQEDLAKRLERTKDFLGTGVAGVRDATQTKINNTKENPDPRSRAFPYAIGAGAGAGGVVGVHRLLDRRTKRVGREAHWAVRAALTRPGGAVAGTLVGLPVANAVQRATHSNYVATPTGVQRRGKPFRPPSAKAQVFDQKKMGRRRYREATVGKASPEQLRSLRRLTEGRHGTRAAGLLRQIENRGIHREELASGSSWAKRRGIGGWHEDMQGGLSPFERKSDEKSIRFRERFQSPDRMVPREGLKVSRPRRRNFTGEDWHYLGLDEAGSHTGTGTRAGVGQREPEYVFNGNRRVRKVHNPHNLVHITSRGTPRKVHWRRDDSMSGVCGLDGAFGRGTGPFAEHYGEVTCVGCKRVMNIAKAAKRLPPSGSGVLAGPSALRRRPFVVPPESSYVMRRLKPKPRLTRAEIEAQQRKASEAARPGWEASREAMRERRYGQHRALQAIQRYHVNKAVEGDTPQNYLGRRVSRGAQRAAIYGAGAAPLGIGPAAAARTAASFAPPGGERKAAARQYAGSGVAPMAAGIGGAVGAARLADRSERAQHAAERVSESATNLKNKAKSSVGMDLNRPAGKLSHMKAGAKTAAMESKAGVKVNRALRGRMLAAGVGYVGAKTIVGQVTGNVATNRNLAAQSRYNLKHPVTKLAGDKPLSKPEQRKLLRRKHRNTVLGSATATLGLGGTAIGASLLPGVRGRVPAHLIPHLEHAGLSTALASGGVGGVTALSSQRIARREVKAEQDKVGKSEPLKTKMREEDAKHYTSTYGVTGPLPKHLDRRERMNAYEARYVASGGRKGEKWQRRADISDKVKTGALAGLTGAGAGMLALRTKPAARALGHRLHTAQRAVDTAAIATGTVGSGAELYAGHARRKRASYTSAPAGVAASALRRMRDYTP